jgi:hypothetical protein
MPNLATIAGQISIMNCPPSFNLYLPVLQKYGDLSLREIGDLSTKFNSPTSPLYDALTGSLILSLCNLTSIVRTAGGTIVDINAQTNLPLKNITMDAIDTMTGTMLVQGSDHIAMSFANLTSISEGNYGQIGKISMPSLTKVLGELQFDSNSIQEISLPALESVGDPDRADLLITNNPNLTTLDVSSLTKAFRNMVIANNPRLGDLSSLENVVIVEKDLNITNCPISAYVPHPQTQEEIDPRLIWKGKA